MVLKSNLLTAARFLSRSFAEPVQDQQEHQQQQQQQQQTQQTVINTCVNQTVNSKPIDPIPLQNGTTDRFTWEYHNVTLVRVPGYGFGIAISGGRDNPHFVHGDSSIAVSDVLKSGPAEGKLLVNDRVVSANGISLENVDYATAVEVLRKCGAFVNLLIRRRVLLHPPSDIQAVTLTKNKKKDEFGLVLGCRIFIKEINNKALMGKDSSLQEGDVILKINNISLENVSLKKAKKLIDGCKEKLELVVKRENKCTNNNNSYRVDQSIHGTTTHRNHNDSISRQTSITNQNVYVKPPTRASMHAPVPPPPPHASHSSHAVQSVAPAMAAQHVTVDVRSKTMFDDPATLKKEEADREDYYGTPRKEFAEMTERYAASGSVPSSSSSTEVKKKKSHSSRTGKAHTLAYSHSSKSERKSLHKHFLQSRSSMAVPPLPDKQVDEVKKATSECGSTDPKTEHRKLTAKEKEEADREDYYGTPAKDFAGIFERYSVGPLPSASPIIEKKRKSFTSNRNSIASSPSKSSTVGANNGNSNHLPPRVDRARKPERFKSAHERLFGMCSTISPNGNIVVNESSTTSQNHGSNRDSMASPEYMNSSSFSVPPVVSTNNITTTTTTSSTTATAFASSSSSSVQNVTRALSTVSSSESSTPYLRSQYQSFLSDLIRSKEPPPPPPPKPSNYQSVYLMKEARIPRLNPPPPVIVSPSVGAAIFPPPPPVTPPISSPSASSSLPATSFPPPPSVPSAGKVPSSNWFPEVDVTDVPSYEARPTVRPPPPSAQDLLLATRRPIDSDTEVSEIFARKSNYDIRSQYYP